MGWMLGCGGFGALVGLVLAWSLVQVSGRISRLEEQQDADPER